MVRIICTAVFVAALTLSPAFARPVPAVPPSVVPRSVQSVSTPDFVTARSTIPSSDHLSAREDVDSIVSILKPVPLRSQDDATGSLLARYVDLRSELQARQAYNSFLHTPHSPSQDLSYSSLGGALAESTPAFQSPYRQWLPQPSYIPASKWRTATGASNRRLPVISFDYVGYQKQGVLMRELLSRTTAPQGQALQGPNDLVFSETGLQKVTLRIMWPGYTHMEWARTIDVNVGGHITRSQLSALISANFARFTEAAGSERPTDAAYTIGPSAIQFEHLVLVGFHNVFEDVWQADVAIDRR